MTTLSKEYMAKLIADVGLSGIKSGDNIARFELLIEAARADLVAENERLNEMAMFFSTYTDPDELEMDEIESAARESFRRANSGVRGTTITRANSYESHVIWATKARVSKELTATRTALAAAEAREAKLRETATSVLFNELDKVDVHPCDKDNRDVQAKLAAPLLKSLYDVLAQPRDDSALRKMIAVIYDECENIAIDCNSTETYLAIRALAEKAKG